MTEAEINAAIAALRAALQTGSKVVEYGDKRVEYKNNEEILEAIRYFQSLLPTTAQPQRISRKYAAVDKGYYKG